MDVNRLRYSVIYILIRARPDISLGLNMCEILQQHQGVVNSSTPPPPPPPCLYDANIIAHCELFPKMHQDIIPHQTSDLLIWVN